MNTLQFLHEKVSKKLAVIYDTVHRVITGVIKNRVDMSESSGSTTMGLVFPAYLNRTLAQSILRSISIKTFHLVIPQILPHTSLIVEFHSEYLQHRLFWTLVLMCLY